MAEEEFRQVARLLQLIVRHAESSVLADLREEELTCAQRALLECRLSGEPGKPTPVPAPGRAVPAPRSRVPSRRAVRALLECICRNYQQPMTLAQCAAKLRLNVSYLSHVFSHAVGLPFKTYLTELRIEKAKGLLRDPARSISEIAFSVGYASENRFRIAFKKVTGVSPKSWRESQQATSPPPFAAK